jgi:class 3 adenylate cyclase
MMSAPMKFRGLNNRILALPLIFLGLWILLPGFIGVYLARQTANDQTRSQAFTAIHSFLSAGGIRTETAPKRFLLSDPDCTLEYVPVKWLEQNRNPDIVENRFYASFCADPRLQTMEETDKSGTSSQYLLAIPIRQLISPEAKVSGRSAFGSPPISGLLIAYVPVLPAMQNEVSTSLTQTKIGIALALLAILFLLWEMRWRVITPLRQLFHVSESIRQGQWNARFALPEGDEMYDLANSFQDTTLWLRHRIVQEEKLRSMFQQFVPAAVAAKALGKNNAEVLAGARYTVTAMVINIRSFKLLMENLPPAETVNVLNEYFSAVNKVIVRHKGIVCRYMGDTVLSLFGVPEGSENHTLLAIKAALGLSLALQDLYVRLSEDKGWELGIGVGIAAGEPIIGHFGSSEHMEYTALGDVVLLAEKMENLSKMTPEEDTIIITEKAYRSVMSEVHVYDLGEKYSDEDGSHHAFAVQGMRIEAKSNLAA